MLVRRKRKRDNAAASWEAKKAALEDVFSKLPIQRDETAKGIPYESMIPGIARQLMLMFPVRA